MKKELAGIIQRAVVELVAKEKLAVDDNIPLPSIESPKERRFGDYSTNIAMILAKKAKMAPRYLAAMVIEELGDGGGLIKKAEVAGPGFVNIFINQTGMLDVLKKIESAGDDFGKTDFGQGKKVQIEFISANPTGPLHVGHGRNAIFGDTLAKIMKAAGFDVQKEYYVNDAGLQIQKLGRSTYLRYRELLGDKIEIPEEHYVGDYIIDVAKELLKQKGDDLTEKDIPDIALYSAEKILDSIKRDCEKSGVVFDNWFLEKSLHDSGIIDKTLAWLKKKEIGYDENGAFWFKTEPYGDDKNRVLVKSDGQKTYFAADVAYHADKYNRGFDLVINVWGADHHGYIGRMKAAVLALGREKDDLDILLIQLVTLIKDGKVRQMSTRSGKFITLRQLLDDGGRDALRYFYLMRRHDAQLEFDVDLAVEQSNKNPVFYAQYMHARICSIFQKAEKEKVDISGIGRADFSLLKLPEERELARHLMEFPRLVAKAAEFREPHRLISYIHTLASMFHHYYHHNRVISKESDLTLARLALCSGCRQVLNNALGLAGITAPMVM